MGGFLSFRDKGVTGEEGSLGQVWFIRKAGACFTGA